MLEGLSWLRKTYETYCVTFAQGLDEPELLNRFGGDPSWARLARRDDWANLEELALFGEVIQVGWCEGWAFVHEDHGYTGTLDETLHAVSAGTVAVTVFRNVNAVTRFCYAKDGLIEASFEPTGLHFKKDPPQPSTLLRLAGIMIEGVEEGDDDEDDYEDDDEDFNPTDAMFALAEAVGVRFDRQSLEDRPLLSSFIRNPFSDFINDLLTQGGDEQTATRLLALLGGQWPTWPIRNLVHIIDGGKVFPDGMYRQTGAWNTLRGEQYREHLETIAVKIVTALNAGQVIASLLNALQETRQKLRENVAELLQALLRFEQRYDGEGARERLLVMTTAIEPDVARHAALALGTLEDQRTIEPLLRVLALYPRERMAVQLLGQLQAQSAIEPLLKLLDPDTQQGDIDFQRAVLKALTQIGDPQTVEPLLRLLQPAPQTRYANSFQQALLAALAQIGGAQVIEPLLKLLNPHTGAPYAYDFQLHLLKTFGDLGDTRVLEPLAQLLNPETGSVYSWYFQERLIKTLRELGDVRPALETVEAALQTSKPANHK